LVGDRHAGPWEGQEARKTMEVYTQTHDHFVGHYNLTGKKKKTTNCTGSSWEFPNNGTNINALVRGWQTGAGGRKKLNH